VEGETVMAGLMTMESACVSATPVESVATAVKLLGPVPVGCPAIVAPVKVRPAGSVPPVMDQVIAPVPPVESSVWL
jgi:hypothetical protein